MTWVIWIALAVVAVALLVMLKKQAARRRHREATEGLAAAADASHESARTRHEGGA